MTSRGLVAAVTVALGIACLAPGIHGDDVPVEPPLPKPLPKALTGYRKIPTTKDETRSTSWMLRGRLEEGDTNLPHGAYADVWAGSLAAGSTLTVTMTSSAFDPYVALVRAERIGDVPLKEDDNSGPGTAARVEHRFVSAATYKIVATAGSTRAVGRYTLHLRVEQDTGPRLRVQGPTTEIRRDRPVSGRLTAKAHTLARGEHYDLYTYRGRKDEVVSVSMQSGEVDPFLFLARRVGRRLEILAAHDDVGALSGQRFTNAEISYWIPADGEYLIIATTSFAGESGPYELRISLDRPAVPELPWKELYANGGDPKDAYALLVGIDDYPGTASDLHACTSDIRLWRDLLVNQYGFLEHNIVTISNVSATRPRILAAFEKHLGQAGPEGVAVFVYSGHGTQKPSSEGRDDSEPDSLDEALAVYGAPPKLSVILDDELGLLLSRLRAGRTLVVLDACHSGTGTRGDTFVKAMPFDPDVFSLPKRYLTDDLPAGDRGVADSPEGAATTRHVLLAACRANEWALGGHPDRPWPSLGSAASLFTFHLVSALRSAADEVTFTQVMDEVRKRVVAFSKERGLTQTPQLEGAAGDRQVAEHVTR